MTHARFAAVFAALAFMLVAGSARAQFDECFPPAAVPDAWTGTIIDEASVSFGNTTEKVCTAVVKEAVKTCKAQVKASQKCYDGSYNGLYKMGLKQCQAEDNSEDRAACKADAKQFRDEGKSDIAFSAGIALAECEGGFAASISTFCLEGLPK